MVICPAWLSSKIQNASGHGGGIMIAFFPVVSHIFWWDHIGVLMHIQVNNPQESHNQPQSVCLAIAHARLELHQKIDDRVFKNM
jgi:hypothetical protein